MSTGSPADDREPTTRDGAEVMPKAARSTRASTRRLRMRGGEQDDDGRDGHQSDQPAPAGGDEGNGDDRNDPPSRASPTGAEHDSVRRDGSSPPPSQRVDALGARADTETNDAAGNAWDAAKLHTRAGLLGDSRPGAATVEGVARESESESDGPDAAEDLSSDDDGEGAGATRPTTPVWGAARRAQAEAERRARARGRTVEAAPSSWHWSLEPGEWTMLSVAAAEYVQRVVQHAHTSQGQPNEYSVHAGLTTKLRTTQRVMSEIAWSSRDGPEPAEPRPTPLDVYWAGVAVLKQRGAVRAGIQRALLARTKKIYYSQWELRLQQSPWLFRRASGSASRRHCESGLTTDEACRVWAELVARGPAWHAEGARRITATDGAVRKAIDAALRADRRRQARIFILERIAAGQLQAAAAVWPPQPAGARPGLSQAAAGGGGLPDGAQGLDTKQIEVLKEVYEGAAVMVHPQRRKRYNISTLLTTDEGDGEAARSAWGLESQEHADVLVVSWPGQAGTPTATLDDWKATIDALRDAGATADIVDADLSGTEDEGPVEQVLSQVAKRKKGTRPMEVVILLANRNEVRGSGAEGRSPTGAERQNESGAGDRSTQAVRRAATTVASLAESHDGIVVHIALPQGWTDPSGTIEHIRQWIAEWTAERPAAGRPMSLEVPNPDAVESLALWARQEQAWEADAHVSWLRAVTVRRWRDSSLGRRHMELVRDAVRRADRAREEAHAREHASRGGAGGSSTVGDQAVPPPPCRTCAAREGVVISDEHPMQSQLRTGGVTPPHLEGIDIFPSKFTHCGVADGLHQKPTIVYTNIFGEHRPCRLPRCGSGQGRTCYTCDHLVIPPGGEEGKSAGRHLFIVFHNRSMTSCNRHLHSIDYKHHVPELYFADLALAAKQRLGSRFALGKIWLSLCAGSQSDALPAAAAGFRYVPLDIVEEVEAHSDKILNWHADIATDSITTKLKEALGCPDAEDDDVLLRVGVVHNGLPCETHSVVTKGGRQHRDRTGAPLPGEAGATARMVDAMISNVKAFLDELRASRDRHVGGRCSCGRRRG